MMSLLLQSGDNTRDYGEKEAESRDFVERMVLCIVMALKETILPDDLMLLFIREVLDCFPRNGGKGVHYIHRYRGKVVAAGAKRLKITDPSVAAELFTSSASLLTESSAKCLMNTAIILLLSVAQPATSETGWWNDSHARMVLCAASQALFKVKPTMNITGLVSWYSKTFDNCCRVLLETARASLEAGASSVDDICLLTALGMMLLHVFLPLKPQQDQEQALLLVLDVLEKLEDDVLVISSLFYIHMSVRTAPQLFSLCPERILAAVIKSARLPSPMRRLTDIVGEYVHTHRQQFDLSQLTDDVQYQLRKRELKETLHKRLTTLMVEPMGLTIMPDSARNLAGAVLAFLNLSTTQIQALQQLVAQPDPDWRLRESHVFCVGWGLTGMFSPQIPDGKSTIAAVQNIFLHDESPRVREAACQTLGRLMALSRVWPGPADSAVIDALMDALQVLIDAINDSELAIRRSALQAIHAVVVEHWQAFNGLSADMVEACDDIILSPESPVSLLELATRTSQTIRRNESEDILIYQNKELSKDAIPVLLERLELWATGVQPTIHGIVEILNALGRLAKYPERKYASRLMALCGTTCSIALAHFPDMEERHDIIRACVRLLDRLCTKFPIHNLPDFPDELQRAVIDCMNTEDTFLHLLFIELLNDIYFMRAYPSFLVPIIEDWAIPIILRCCLAKPLDLASSSVQLLGLLALAHNLQQDTVDKILSTFDRILLERTSAWSYLSVALCRLGLKHAPLMHGISSGLVKEALQLEPFMIGCERQTGPPGQRIEPDYEGEVAPILDGLYLLLAELLRIGGHIEHEQLPHLVERLQQIVSDGALMKHDEPATRLDNAVGLLARLAGSLSLGQ